MSSTIPPRPLGMQVYCTLPSKSFETSLVVMRCSKSSARGPLTQISPMWLTSKTPAPLRTAMCSSLMPVNSMGMLYPANSAILAPAAMWYLVNTVVFICNECLMQASCIQNSSEISRWKERLAAQQIIPSGASRPGADSGGTPSCGRTGSGRWCAPCGA